MSSPEQSTPQIDEYAEGVVPPAPIGTPSKPQKKFDPWHKPRKQIVRHSWSAAINRLMRELRVPIGSPKVIRYFTLPAPEMLDIRHLKQCVTNRQYQVQYIGFTNARTGSDDDAQLQLGKTQLSTQTAWVHQASNILYHRLEDLVSGEQPVARRQLNDYAPFHVINFDLCDHILAPEPKGKLLDALEQIIHMQTARPNGSNDWLLFVATRFDPKIICEKRFARIRDTIVQNCSSSTDFKSGLTDLISMPFENPQTDLSDPSSLSQETMRDLVTVGLSKWIAGLLLKANPPFKLNLLNAFAYAVDGSKQDMLSLVYRCEYAGSPSPPPNSSHTNSADLLSPEVKIALAVLEKAKQTCDLDEKLKGDHEQWMTLANETKELLRSANISDALMATYDDWASDAAKRNDGQSMSSAI
jgi:hypothetical protein